MTLIKLAIIILVGINSFCYSVPLDETGAGQPEFYFYIVDNVGAYYRIKAEKYGNSPIFDDDFNYATNLDFAWDMVDGSGSPQSFYAQNTALQNKGFDWRSGTPSGERGLLGYGIYKISVQSTLDPPEQEEDQYFSDVLIFYLNVRSVHPGWTGSPDMWFELTFSSGDFVSGYVHGYMPPGGTQQNTTISNGVTIKIWEVNQGWTLDEDDFIENVELKNDFSGTGDNNIKIILKEKNEGFPTTKTDYPINYQFATGVHAEFWRGATYKFTVTDEVKNGNKIRHWNEDIAVKIGKEVNIPIVTQQEEITAYYKPAVSQTNINDLEGIATDGTYDLTWVTPEPDKLYNYLESANDTYVYEYGQLYEDKYNITVVQNLTNVLGTNWTFLEWENGSTNLTRTGLQFTEENQFSAKYKGIQRSNNSASFENSSQQKVVKSSDGKIHMVYESLGRVWYERSTDNGSTWVLMNGGNPLSSNDSKHPSIDAYGTMVSIVWQEKNGSGWSLKVAVFSDTSKRGESIFATGSNWSLDTTPSIAWGYNGKAVIVYRDYNSFGNLSICYRVGSFSYYVINWYGSEGYISNSSTTSYNPSIAVLDALDASSWPLKFHVAWESTFSTYSSRHIEYQRIDVASNGTATINSSSYKEISTYSYGTHYGPYPTNERASLDVKSNGEVQIVWVGRNSYSKVMKRSMSSTGVWGSSFSYFDDYYILYSPTVRYASDGDYVIGWGRDNGSYAKYWNSSSQSISSTNKIGRDIHLVKQTNSTQVKGVVFNSLTTPYSFSATSNVLTKNGSEETYRFREAVIARNGFSYIFNFGNVRLDNEPIGFKPLVDSLNLASKDILAEYIMTEPFVFDNNADITFSIYSEIVGDENAILKSNENVEFLVELIDAGTKNVLGLYKKAEYKKDKKEKLEKHNFRVKGEGIGDKKVQLRVSINDNIGEGYFLSEIYTLGDSTLIKTTEIESNFKGLLAVDDYSLSQNYPNPFNPQTTIAYKLPNDGFVTLKIYDVLGKEIVELVNEYKTSGSYEVMFDGSKLASGIYFYKLSSGDFAETKKLILMK